MAAAKKKGPLDVAILMGGDEPSDEMDMGDPKQTAAGDAMRAAEKKDTVAYAAALERFVRAVTSSPEGDDVEEE
jgi:hypothetical protein